MNFILSTDSTCDLSLEQFAQYGIEHVSLSYRVDGEEYGGDSGKSMSLSDFYNAMREGKKTGTSMVNEQQATEYFEGLLDKSEGKDILHVCFASVLSGTYECMQKVANVLNETHQNKIFVVDSKCACQGEGLLVMLVAEYAQNHTAKETYEYAESLKGKIVHLFTVETLKYLCAGGRVSKATATVGNLLSIKPVMCVDDEGHLVAKTKAIGRKASLNKLIAKTIEKFSGEYKKLYISHADCKDDADYLSQALEEKLGIKAEVGNIGNVIGGHSGPGTVAIFFVGENRTF